MKSEETLKPLSRKVAHALLQNILTMLETTHLLCLTLKPRKARETLSLEKLNALVLSAGSGLNGTSLRATIEY